MVGRFVREWQAAGCPTGCSGEQAVVKSRSAGHDTLMFLRRNRRTVDGQTYEYWTLVRTVRTAKGPRQEVVAALGKTPGLDKRSRHGWDNICDLLEGCTAAVRRCTAAAMHGRNEPRSWATRNGSHRRLWAHQQSGTPAPCQTRLDENSFARRLRATIPNTTHIVNLTPRAIWPSKSCQVTRTAAIQSGRGWPLCRPGRSQKQSRRPNKSAAPAQSNPPG